MSFNVRLFGFRGIQQIPLIMPKQFSSDSVFQLVYPYEWGAVLVVSGTAISSAAQTVPDATQILRIEVPDAQSIRYEINPPNRTGGAKTADTTSPILSGINQFYFGPSWTISAIDASGLP